METTAREAMVQGALLALLFHFNEHRSDVKADRVTVTLHVDGCISFADVTYWAGDVVICGEGF